MVGLFLQQRADLGARLRQIGVLVDYNDQAAVARHCGKRIECLVKAPKRHAYRTRLTGEHRLTKVLQVRLYIGAASLKINGVLALDELCDETRFAHAPATVNHGHLK